MCYYDADKFEEAFDAPDRFPETNVSYYDFEKAIQEIHDSGRNDRLYYLKNFTNIEIFMEALYL